MTSKEESSMSENNRLNYFRLGCQGRLEGLTYNLRPETCKGHSLSKSQKGMLQAVGMAEMKA